MIALWWIWACAEPSSLEALPEPGAPPAIAIWPERPEAGVDELVCYVTAGWEPGVEYQVRWANGGAIYEGAGTRFMEGDTVSAADTTGGDRWSCEVTATVGEISAEPVSTEVTVRATGPARIEAAR